MTQTLSVSAIKNGTVIDHIPAGQALKLIRLLKLYDTNHEMTIGVNLTSKSLGAKDLIKIANKVFSENEASQITLFSPQATINFIENFAVVKKINNTLPNAITGIFPCPNNSCISRVEPIESCFAIEEYGKHVYLTCKYCEKMCERDHVMEYLAWKN
jgi:aspartate carbamoyltransferase regulatory subunit